MNKKIVVVLLIVLAVLTGGYLSGVSYYKDKFPSNVYNNKTNVGGMTLKDADKELAKTDKWNKVIIKTDAEKLLEIDAKEIGYKYNGSPDLPKIFNEQNKWKWFLSLFKDSTYTTQISSDYNKDKIKEMINGLSGLDKDPVNAKAVYSESSNAFVIEPHSSAVKVSKEQLFNLVSEAIGKRDSEVNIEKYRLQPTIFADDKSLIAAKDKANQYLNMQLKYDFEDREEVIDRSVLKNLIVVKGKEMDVDSAKVKNYVDELANKYDTYGKGRAFKTSTGQNITISGGSYGWMTNRVKTTAELINHIKSGENKTIKPVYSYKALTRKANDIGNSYVEIDLKQQMVSVYIGGQLKIQTPTVTGNVSKGHSTPRGVFPLNYKEKNAVLRGADYASPVKYWMPFNGGVGLHDADWRNSFGKDIYINSGSHGCVNLPPSNAKIIYDLVYPGMPVIVH